MAEGYIEKIVGIDFPNSTNASLSSLLNSGIYYVLGDNLTDSPDGGNGLLIVLASTTNSGIKKQIWLPYRTPGTNDNHVYVRGYNAPNWGKWAQYTGTIID